MKKNKMKNIKVIGIILVLVLLSGCSKNNQNNLNNQTLSPQPTVNAPSENVGEEDTENTLFLEDYFPLAANTVYEYEGAGNEYASYYRVIDYIDKNSKRLQTRSNNGGTETVRVLEIKDGKLTVLTTINECYYRENIMEKAVAGSDLEVLLMEPLVEGTTWNLADGRKRTITSTKADITTPYGSYQALEVTTEDDEGVAKDYYGYQVGLVKSIYTSQGMEVTSTLSKISTSTPYTQTLEIFYPNEDGNINVEQIKLTFYTGDDTKEVLREALINRAKEENNLGLISINTKINQLYLGDDNVVHVDFSKEFVTDMNLGPGFEQLILQSITNTLGSYYGVEEVAITIEGKAYESGHIIMKEGETFKVNMDKVVR